MLKKFRFYVIISAAVALVVLLLNRDRKEFTTPNDNQVEILVPPETAAETATESETPPPPVETKIPDDLTLISGIGPKISSVLQDAGVNTFDQLAGMSVESLEQILDQAGIRLGKPDTWIQQAEELT
jgi:predicted flap endonuclease-1-like 5' DNA nuclease